MRSIGFNSACCPKKLLPRAPCQLLRSGGGSQLHQYPWCDSCPCRAIRPENLFDKRHSWEPPGDARPDTARRGECNLVQRGQGEYPDGKSYLQRHTRHESRRPCSPPESNSMKRRSPVSWPTASSSSSRHPPLGLRRCHPRRAQDIYLSALRRVSTIPRGIKICRYLLTEHIFNDCALGMDDCIEDVQALQLAAYLDND